MAQKYNNISVLENHSSDLLNIILDSNLYLQLLYPDDPETIIDIKKWIKIFILNTDMKYHFQHVQEILNFVEKSRQFNDLNDVEEECSAGLDQLLGDSKDENTQDSSHDLTNSYRSSVESLQSCLEKITTDTSEKRSVLLCAILHASGIFLYFLVLNRYK